MLARETIADRRHAGFGVSYLGLGLVWGVLYASFSTTPLFATVGYHRVPNDLFNLTVLPVVVIVYLVLAFLSIKGVVTTLTVPRHLPTASVAAGILMLALVPDGYGSGAPALILAGILVGAGSALLLTAWRATFVFDTSGHAARRFIMASCGGSVLCFVFMYLPPVVALPLSLVCMVASDLLLGSVRHDMGQAVAAPKTGMTGKAFSVILPSLLFVCILEFLFTSSSQIALGGSQGFDANHLFNFAILISAVLLVALVCWREKAFGSWSLYDVIFFAVGGALLVLPFLGTDWGGALAMLVVGCANVVSVILTVLVFDVAQDLEADPVAVLALQDACVQAASFLGVMLTFVFAGQGFGSMQLLLLAFAGIYLLGTALAFMVRRLSVKQPAEHAGPTVADLALADLDPMRKAELARLAEAMFEERCDELAGRGNLTPRESDVLRCLAQGLSIEQTAAQLVVSINTVKTHAKMVYVKLDIHSRQDLVALLREQVEG